MANMLLAAPLVPQAFYERSEGPALRQKLDEIEDTLGTRFDLAISHIADLTNTPSQLIKAIVFEESGGDWSVAHGGAIGLMQMMPTVADATLWFETRKDKATGRPRLSADEKAIVLEYLPARDLER